MKRSIIAALLSIALTGCAATWPSVCPVENKQRICKCAVAKFEINDHPDKPSPPAGLVTLDCDGTPIPIKVYGQRVDR
tara:strand:- start:1094 stop:1327 length:234 start_codon:yes stop_codon:yes gene_type:complete